MEARGAPEAFIRLILGYKKSYIPKVGITGQSLPHSQGVTSLVRRVEV